MMTASFYTFQYLSSVSSFSLLFVVSLSIHTLQKPLLICLVIPQSQRYLPFFSFLHMLRLSILGFHCLFLTHILQPPLFLLFIRYMYICCSEFRFIECRVFFILGINWVCRIFFFFFCSVFPFFFLIWVFEERQSIDWNPSLQKLVVPFFLFLWC